MNIFETIQKQLTAAAGSSENEVPLLLPFFMEGTEKKPCILVCPGGGYGFTSPREAEPIARAYNQRGFHVMVLHYRVAPHRHPAPLLDVSNTLSLIRKHADDLGVNPEKIVVCGFSAGGHLTASLGVHWNKPYLQNGITHEQGLNRPNGLILSYPVITSGEYAHRGSFENLLGPDPSQESLEEMSLEKQVGKQTPPAFLWHTLNDASVPVENSLLFAGAMKKAEVPFELHIFPEGPHGISLATAETDETGNGSMTDPHVAQWLELSARWVKEFI